MCYLTLVGLVEEQDQVEMEMVEEQDRVEMELGRETESRSTMGNDSDSSGLLWPSSSNLSLRKSTLKHRYNHNQCEYVQQCRKFAVLVLAPVQMDTGKRQHHCTPGRPQE